MQTPQYAALPMLHIVHEAKGEAARDYVARHCSAARVVPLGFHFIFWEFADRFNEEVTAFLKEHTL